MSKSIFAKIIDREIPAEILFEDDLVIAIRDIAPKAPVHLLVIPKKPIVSLEDLTPEDASLIGHLYLTIQAIARRDGFANAGYRVVVNCGADGGQEVPHLHFHVMAGTRLSWFK